MNDKPKRVDNKLAIRAYLHCGLCLQEKPGNIAPDEWSRLDIGWTAHGLQVWCRRHECNVMHVDFEGATHPADTSRRRQA